MSLSEISEQNGQKRGKSRHGLKIRTNKKSRKSGEVGFLFIVKALNHKQVK